MHEVDEQKHGGNSAGEPESQLHCSGSNPDAARENIVAHLTQITEMIRQKATGQSSDPYLSFEEFVLRNGRHFDPVPFPARLGYRGYQALLKSCFRNAYLLARHHPNKLRYAEGFAIPGGRFDCPFMHAWCVDLQDRAIDPTWHDGVAYYGVIFDMGYAAEVVKVKREYGVLDNWKQRFPLLTGEHAAWKPSGHDDREPQPEGERKQQ
ncbi:MAG TPA: hypothetical protein PLE77_02960 [Kiritimatiellia bacterium]|nr:hypothetical protein [Kiritimatiellia bacterium]